MTSDPNVAAERERQAPVGRGRVLPAWITLYDTETVSPRRIAMWAQRSAEAAQRHPSSARYHR